MAIKHHDGQDYCSDKGLAAYAACVITPMTTDDEGNPILHPVHLVDATIVGGIVFFSVLLGQSVLAVVTGQGPYLSIEDVYRRLLTAGLGFGLTFLAQWARYRGIQLIISLNGGE